MRLSSLVDRIRAEPPYAPPECPFPALRLECKTADPIPWKRSDVERDLGFPVHDHLAELWDLCGGLTLYEDSELRARGVREEGHCRTRVSTDRCSR